MSKMTRSAPSPLQRLIFLLITSASVGVICSRMGMINALSIFSGRVFLLVFSAGANHPSGVMRAPSGAAAGLVSAAAALVAASDARAQSDSAEIANRQTATTNNVTRAACLIIGLDPF